MLASVALSASSACTSTKVQAVDQPPPKVTAARVLARDVTEFDEFTGRLEAIDFVDIRPRVSGYIDSIHFVEGGLVRRGDLLFQIDPRPFQAEVDRLRAELDSARATVIRTESELQRADRLDPAHAISREERQRREAAARTATADVGATEAALRAAELNLQYTRVTSPIDGRVSRALVTKGNLVSSAGDATRLTTVVSLDPIYATFDVDEHAFLRYLSQMRDTMRAGVPRSTVPRSNVPIGLALATDRDFAHTGTLFFVDNRVDPAAGTIRVRAIYRNPDRRLTPGLFVRVRLPGGGTHRGLLVQDRAIGTDLDKRFVLVVTRDRVVQYRMVTLGPLIDGLRLIRGGLDVDDLVIVNGLQRVRPGARVDVTTVGMDEPITTTQKPASRADAPSPEN